MFSRTCTVLASLAAVRAAVIDVTVGGPGGVVQFNPEFVNASVGDTIRFTFQQKNHSVTQSSLQSPCVPLANGFDSGFVPVGASVTSNFPIAELNITDTNPIWAFCRQANHCQQGMVFAVNPGANFDAFKAAATGASNTSSSSTSSSSTTAAATGVVTVTATVTVSNTNAITTTYGSYPGSAAPTSASSSDHQVTVGAGGVLTYSPSNITAQPGDTVTFQFHQKNHTVTQSSFAAPCRPLGDTSTTGAVGFDSGFMFVAENATTFPTFTIQINDTTPIWVYCRQLNHCGSGMVFSVNAIESGPNNFEAFLAKAKTLNGTNTNNSTTSNNSGAISSNVHGAGIVFAVAGIVFGSLW